MRPIIAIIGDQVHEVSPVINMNNADMAPNEIKRAVTLAGGLPIILPVSEDSPAVTAELADQYVAGFDALILPGGFDVDPTLYGEEPIPECGPTLRPKDLFEVPLIRATISAGKPIFAICRGMQILNVALGGTLYQDITAQDAEATIKHEQSARGDLPTHHVNFTSAATLATIFGPHAYVNSRHHQAIRQIADGLHVTATAPDGVIEGIESDNDDQIIGVQWHPENMYRESEPNYNLFVNLVERAQRFAAQD
ncbi:gamma-glutamyl-gamma-aminobutyrate hydrolase family protein [Lacticaseibacillus pabuli]|uniref:Gamma-glutamyl-gamma-aminobutyrate hydrolase family protein n=1 Tax=Lacticaseibacillus pabuli TaxID=3025672 RepID=A0ABY7WS39_9LACO|nr:gamma-glutamyl-gamma-aminobutyrate hydrolase family protein [Lacticaseibacillus sp. KACC 23028]WDF82998.1 gamma-glutamyl-gamma-aminobutyrate hydrolase family protein [Lacticaseibacillus sp. KACC 23028]